MPRPSRKAAAAAAPPPVEERVTEAVTQPVPNGQDRPTIDQLIASLSQATPGSMTKFYLGITAEREKHEKMVKLMKGYQRRVATIILDKMQHEEIDGFRAEGRVVYPYTLQVWSVPDVETFREYVLGIDDGLDLVTFTPNKEACDNFVDTYGEPPDGSKRDSLQKLGCRKA